MKVSESSYTPDFNSPTHKWWVEQFQAMETSCLGKLRGMQSEIDTAALRGDLRTVKTFLSLPDAYSKIKTNG